MPDPKDYASIGYIGPNTRQGNRKDDMLARDRDAYRRLRDSGLHPSHVTGSDHLERHADMPIEVELGHAFKTKQGKALAREGVERSMELGLRGPQ